MFIDKMLFKDVMHDLQDGVYIMNTERRIVSWNQSAERITGYKAEEIVGRLCQDNILDHIDVTGRPLCILGCPLFETIVDGERRVAEVFLRHKDGHRIMVQAKCVPVWEDGVIVGAAEIFTMQNNVFAYSELLSALAEKSMTDTLTGLPNRQYLSNFLEYKLKEHQRFNRPFCVLFMDIDDFREFNNNFGHHVGDKLLRAIAASFSHNLRGVDMMGRWGGEEFVGVFTIDDPQESTLLGEKICTLVAGSHILNEGERISITCSVGVAIVREDDTIDGIVQRADQFMYQSKKHGKNCYSVEDIDGGCAMTVKMTVIAQGSAAAAANEPINSVI